jgi:cell division protein FtsZ
VAAPELEDKVLVTVLASGYEHMEPALTASKPMSAPLLEQMTPPQPVSSRIYGEAQTGQESQQYTHTPTRLLAQPPTPSGEMSNLTDDLHVPAIIRLNQGRLPIE